MLLEGFVSLTALIAACSLEPGDYFKINTEESKYEQLVTDAKTEHQWDLQPREFDQLKKEAGIKEKLQGRTAGAVTLALGMAKILADLPGMRPLMAYLYHFVVMFEALFILTLLETGTRVARFILQDVLAVFLREAKRRPRNVLDPQRGRQRGRLRDVGISVVSFRVRRAVGDDGNRQPTAGGHRAGHRHRLPVDARAEAECTPYAPAIPFVAVTAIVFTAGIQSVSLWWQQQASPGITDAEAFSLPLDVRASCASILAVGALIVFEIVRRCCSSGRNGAAETEAEIA